MSSLKPQLDANNVRMVAIGLEELGVEEFVEGKFWDGELYIDLKKETYKALGFKRMGFVGVFSAVLGKKGRDATAEARKEKLGGNLAGDGWQNGGALIVSPGGTVLLNYIQENAADHVPLEDVLKALKIDGSAPRPEGGTTSNPAEEGATGNPQVVCDDDVCQIKK